MKAKENLVKRKENAYQKSVQEVLKEVESSMEGLTMEEAQKRIEIYGKNELPKRKKDSFLKILWKEFAEPIELLLVVAMSCSFVIGEIVDGCAILLILAIDLFMGALQEWKANKTAESLSKLLEDKARVLRDEEEVELPSNELVIGDIVFLESGDFVSADMRLIDCSNLTMDESALTGESIGVEKQNVKLKPNTMLSERKNMLYAGTNVLSGRAIAIVVATAGNTEIGKIAGSVAETKETKSPLTIRMEKFSKQISILVVVVAILIAVVLSMKQVAEYDIFLSVIALSVSAMPEGLPLALTMALTIASNRMSKKNVIVKKLNAVESLGSCTVIASDKTGTLTVNEQTAKKILLPNGNLFEVEGSGYNGLGAVIPISGAHLSDAEELAKLGVLNNEAVLKKTGMEYEKMGDSIDIAFLALGMKLKVNLGDIQIQKRIPYESENKYSAVFYREKQEMFGTVKGSFETVLKFCSKMKMGSEIVPIDMEKLSLQNESLAKQGYRVIALAKGKVDTNGACEMMDFKEFTFVGFVAFIDPIREEVKDSILECKKAGIKVAMITGDHPLTAYAIASELGLVESQKEVATGIEIQEQFKKGLDFFDEFVKRKKVFTRVSPLDKLEIVESYKRQGEFVAVTGDGMNDAPAIKSANIGIAMGSGTDVAKETASMIVLDDNFNSIVAGIKEGRNAYSNIRKVSYMLLSCGVAEVFFFLFSILFDLPMPLLAVQLLWLNIVTDGLQDFALSFEKAETGIMQEKPVNPKESIFNFDLLIEVLMSGLTIGLVVFGVWYYLIEIVKMEAIFARGYIMMLMVFIQNMHVLNCRSEKKSIFQTSFFTNPMVLFSIVSAIVLQIIVSEVPIFSELLKIKSVPILAIGPLLLFSFVIIIVMEGYKKIRYQEK